jgi:hypothetical protein
LAQLDKISRLVTKTKNLYQTMISTGFSEIALCAFNVLERFPHSSNVMNLYARFSAVVLADRDYAKELTENAKDLEHIQLRTEGNSKDDDNQSQKSIEKIEQMSVGSSNTSDRSRLLLIMRKKREVMEERLNAPIRDYIRNANVFTLIFVLLMAASASLSYTQIFKTNDGIIIAS